MKARTLKEYNEAWKHHIEELTALALAANVTYDNFQQVTRELKRWLELAKERQINLHYRSLDNE